MARLGPLRGTLVLLLLGLLPESSAAAQAGRSCGPFNACPRGFSCLALVQRCARNGGALAGEPCGPGFGCRGGLLCVPGEQVCRARGTAGESCGPGRPCQDGLSCVPGRQVCARPGGPGDACGPGNECAPGLSCEAFSQVCRRPGQINDACGPTRPCANDLQCQPVIQKCAPRPLNLNSGQMCGALRVEELSAAARGGNVTMSYGAGGDTQVGAAMSMETGVVYGRRGEFGCYASICAGFQTDVSINAYMTLGIFRDYADFAGQSLMTTQGVSTPFVQIGPGYTTAQVASVGSRQLVGTANSVSFGVGVSPVPFQLGALTCCTAVIDGNTGRLRDLNGAVNQCQRDLEGVVRDVSRAVTPPPVGSPLQPAPGAPALQVGGEQSGRIDATTPRFEERPVAFFRLACAPGQRLRFEAESRFDNVLVVADASGRRVAFADDISSQNRNARLEWRCPDASAYQVGVGAYDASSAGGDFRLRTTSLGGAAATAGTTVPPGNRGAPVRVGETVSGSVSPSLPRFRGRPVRVHPFGCEAGRSVRIEVSAAFDSVLTLYDAQGRQVAFNDDVSQSDRNPRIVHRCGASTVHQIAVHAFQENQGGRYQLRVTPVR